MQGLPAGGQVVDDRGGQRRNGAGAADRHPFGLLERALQRIRKVADEAAAVGQVDVVRAGACGRECNRIRLLLERAGGVDHQVDVERGQGLLEVGGIAVDRDGAGAPIQSVGEALRPRGVASGDQQLDASIARKRTADAGAEVAVAAQYQCLHPLPVPPLGRSGQYRRTAVLDDCVRRPHRRLDGTKNIKEEQS